MTSDVRARAYIAVMQIEKGEVGKIGSKRYNEISLTLVGLFRRVLTTEENKRVTRL